MGSGDAAIGGIQTRRAGAATSGAWPTGRVRGRRLASIAGMGLVALDLAASSLALMIAGGIVAALGQGAPSAPG
jgi:hypothetical protein